MMKVAPAPDAIQGHRGDLAKSSLSWDDSHLPSRLPGGAKGLRSQVRVGG